MAINPETICDPETARQELEKFTEACGIDIEGGDDEDKEFVLKIQGYIERGIISVTEDGWVQYELRAEDAPFKMATFKEPTGRDMKALDKAKEGKGVTKLYAFIASMVGRPEADMSKLKKRDLNVLSALARLFLG